MLGLGVAKHAHHPVPAPGHRLQLNGNRTLWGCSLPLLSGQRVSVRLLHPFFLSPFPFPSSSPHLFPALASSSCSLVWAQRLLSGNGTCDTDSSLSCQLAWPLSKPPPPACLPHVACMYHCPSPMPARPLPAAPSTGSRGRPHFRGLLRGAAAAGSLLCGWSFQTVSCSGQA